MKRTVPTLLLISAMALSASAAELIVPVAGATEGALGSSWQSDLVFHNIGSTMVSAEVTLHTSAGATESIVVLVGPGRTVLLQDVVGTEMNLSNVTGALVIEVDDFAARKLIVNSRTYTTGPAGPFGHDIPVYRSDELSRAGDTAVITGPADVDLARFNFGIYAATDSEVEWTLVRSDGTRESSLIEAYEAGTQFHYNAGIRNFLGLTPMNGDVIYARVRSGDVITYGTTIDNLSNDPSFTRGITTRENFDVALLGVDMNQDGVIDIADADGDGVLDQPMEIAISGFPTTLRVVAVDPEGEQVELVLLTQSGDISLRAGGILQIYPFSTRKGTSDTIMLRASDGVASTDFVLPVVFR